MTSFAPTSKTSFATATTFPKLSFATTGARFLVWYDRVLQRRRLRNLDDRMLNDIGVSRMQAEAEARKPAWVR